MTRLEWKKLSTAARLLYSNGWAINGEHDENFVIHQEESIRYNFARFDGQEAWLEIIPGNGRDCLHDWSMNIDGILGSMERHCKEEELPPDSHPGWGRLEAAIGERDIQAADGDAYGPEEPERFDAERGF